MVNISKPPIFNLFAEICVINPLLVDKINIEDFNDLVIMFKEL